MGGGGTIRWVSVALALGAAALAVASSPLGARVHQRWTSSRRSLRRRRDEQRIIRDIARLDRAGRPAA